MSAPEVGSRRPQGAERPTTRGLPWVLCGEEAAAEDGQGEGEARDGSRVGSCRLVASSDTGIPVCSSPSASVTRARVQRFLRTLITSLSRVWLR